MRTGPGIETRKRILMAAEAVMGERGYNGARLHEIAARVGVKKASLFHYFASKEDLYHAVLKVGFGETEGAIRRTLVAPEDNPLGKLCGLVETYVDMVMSHPARTKILLRQSLGDAPDHEAWVEPERLLKLVVDFIAEGQRRGLLAQVDAHGLVLGIIGMVAFFCASAPVLTPGWLGDVAAGGHGAGRIKRHVVDVVCRCLRVAGEQRTARFTRAAG